VAGPKRLRCARHLPAVDPHRLRITPPLNGVAVSIRATCGPPTDMSNPPSLDEHVTPPRTGNPDQTAGEQSEPTHCSPRTRHHGTCGSCPHRTVTANTATGRAAPHPSDTGQQRPAPTTVPRMSPPNAEWRHSGETRPEQQPPSTLPEQSPEHRQATPSRPQNGAEQTLNEAQQ